MKRFFVLVGFLMCAHGAWAQQFNASNTQVNQRSLGSILGTPTGAMQLPTGTTAEEPDTGNIGEARFNTTTNDFEFGMGGSWDNFALSGGSATTASIGGAALTAGQCASTTVPVADATTAMAVDVTPATYPGDGAWWEGYVSATGTVTVKVCASVAMTPVASVYNVRVTR